MNKKQALEQIDQRMGRVPNFMRQGPELAVPAMWGMMRDGVLGETAIAQRTKWLIGVACAAALPDPYRLERNLTLARAVGCGEAEIGEAIALAGETVFFSTWINGVQYDYDTFKQETLGGLDHVRSLGQPPRPTSALSNRQEVLADLQAVFGAAPGFFAQVPDPVLPHAWQMFRGLSLGETIIAPVDKELIGLAVATAVSCRYCTLFHSEVAKLHGATEDQLREAAVLVASERLDSTLLNGLQYDLGQFRKDLKPLADSARTLVSDKRST